ncbi:uncharacterized protein CLUP02_10108 [Colletotrichum lupini]|uniref:Uncharacterized protein n=1 Tax=Colletotrichum lupini TaxID=145971 RepID=A0A9Q8SXN6_9PEZI|nr:uncharacterized protein CLUP02_10108 [Colletotrichum lupini]UQC84611.1 hypothetical protein CLUP02_10108 [Colletotrichum lupini]
MYLSLPLLKGDDSDNDNYTTTTDTANVDLSIGTGSGTLRLFPSSPSLSLRSHISCGCQPTPTPTPTPMPSPIPAPPVPDLRGRYREGGSPFPSFFWSCSSTFWTSASRSCPMGHRVPLAAATAAAAAAGDVGTCPWYEVPSLADMGWLPIRTRWAWAK